MQRRVPLVIGVVATLLAVTASAGCSGPAAPAASVTIPATASDPARSLPPTTGAADYQLGGSYAPASGVTVVERDSTSKPAQGIYSICYVNGFQTQPGVAWPSHLLLHRADGTLLVDPGWPGEHLLDVSTAAKREAAARIQEKTIRLCAAKGFRGVEFDNLDAYSRSKGALTLDDDVAFATVLTAYAHREGLAVAQKNTTELGSRGRDEIRFDFAVSEQCDRYSECSAFTSVYGAHVIDVEYTGDLRGTFAEVCARTSTPRMTMLRDPDLVAQGQRGYHYQHC